MDSSLIPDKPQIVFLGGTGRSGTNITKDVLSRHSQIVTLPFEYRFIIDPDGLVDFYRSYSTTWSPYLADRRLKRLEALLKGLTHEPLFHRIIGDVLRIINRDGKVIAPRRYHGWNLDNHLPNYSQYVQNLMAELREFAYSSAWVGTESYALRSKIYHAGPKTEEELAVILNRFINSIIIDLLTYHDKTVYVEDNTWNILFARELIQLVPQAKILHIYRDPRDVVASLTQQRWSPTDTEEAALWYRSLMTHWIEIRSDLPKECYLEFSLETLVDMSEKTIRSICGFIQLPYEPVLLNVDLSRSNRGRWLHQFSSSEKQVVENILGDVITLLGYE